MNKLCLKISALVAASAFFGVTFVAARDTADATLREIADYRQWTRVNAEPLVIPIDIASVGG